MKLCECAPVVSVHPVPFLNISLSSEFTVMGQMEADIAPCWLDFNPNCFMCLCLPKPVKLQRYHKSRWLLCAYDFILKC